MSAMLPPEAICLVYRRYLKSANKIPNVTIRMLLLQQVRFGFRRHLTLTNPTAQRELVRQAHKDLAILEDDRLSRTLYINKLGMVSCLDWEVRRTEYHMRPAVQRFVYMWITVGFCFILYNVLHAESNMQATPEISEMVAAMAMRLEGDTPKDVLELRQQQVLSGVERKRHRISVEERVLSTFHESPRAQQPSLRYPDGVART